MIKKSSSVLAIALVFIMLSAAIIPVTLGLDASNVEGFDKGPSYKPVVPMKKATFVNFDENSYLDDYAYLAAVPTAVFDDGDKLYSNPLLYYQDEYPIKEDKEKSLNARQGLNYFMEDWMSYCNGEADQMTLINVPKNKLDSSWKAKEYNVIKSDDPYELASKLALSEWSYSDSAVVAVINKDFEKYSVKTDGEINGEFSIDKEVKKIRFEVPQTNKLNPQFREFNVPEGYMYIQGRAWYSCLYLGIPGLVNISIPSGDKDFQLYCKYDDDWMQVAAVDAWNAKSGMDTDYGKAYIYKPGQWLAGITDVPTKKVVGHYGSWKEIFSNMRKGVEYKLDIEMYPGVKIPFDVSPPFYCRDAEFKFKCSNPNTNFGFLLIGPGGEKIKEDEDGIIKLDKLGECLPGEKYQFVIYTKEDTAGSFDYKISYSWNQNKTRDAGDSLTSATEGAVLASTLNAPLIYVSSSQIPQETIDVLYKLGVKNIYLVDLGDLLSSEVKNRLEDIASIKEDYEDYDSIYHSIRDLSGNTDIVFSTLDSWTCWNAGELKPASEKEGALFLGPAAYIAAHHGSPVIIIDNHPELSSASMWHTEFWRAHPNGYRTPMVAEMYLTGSRIYNFLDEHGFDEKGMETIITVAGQYDIGASWDRALVGRAATGRFTFSPVDSSYWISRSVFYPALIYENPAMNPSGLELINGSKSIRGPLGRLKIVRPSGEESFKYPVLQSFMPVYIHRFNERASKYWGFTYQCPDGIIPGVSNSFSPVDDGVNLKSTGEAGSFWPDLSETDCVPFYLDKCGYNNVFSTSFSPVMDNLNSGCLMWIVGTHGNSLDGGSFMFNDPNSKLRSNKEPNPWRGYEWYLGSTEEPDTMTTEIHGIIPMLFNNPNWNGVFRTSLDFAPAKRPVLDIIGNLLSRPILDKLTPRLGWLKDTEDYYDGIVGSSFLSTLGTVEITGFDIDESIENIHSCGLITAACLPAYKYLHLTMVRHGSPFQIIDPWGTSWYSSFWEATIPRDIALGDTIGEAYVKGMGHVGILYITDPPQWWWDKAENVCYFGDPDLRVFTPGTEYSDNNHWEKDDVQPIRYDEELTINGHMPFGATDYPNEREPVTLLQEYLGIIVALAIIVVLIIAVAAAYKKKKN